MLDPALHLNIADPQWAEIFNRLGSFPSDTSTLFFSLAAIIFVENRLVGCFCFLWVLAIIGVPRVVFGWHYPSDIVGGLILGPACVYLFIKIPYVAPLSERALKSFQSRMYIVHALLFVFLADASNLFIGLQLIKLLLLNSLRSFPGYGIEKISPGAGSRRAGKIALECGASGLGARTPQLLRLGSLQTPTSSAARGPGAHKLGRASIFALMKRSISSAAVMSVSANKLFTGKNGCNRKA